ncbi:hypothetical protein [Sulfurovum sp.]|uniref:hypothetical protein n=1 Tax=Sulfurovum sp. TaxID=1969726 RepID=UPI002867BC81|nr:hypothetical protein [Sulfurovum sp.]
MVKFFIAVILLVQFDLGMWWWIAFVVACIVDIIFLKASDDTMNSLTRNQQIIENEILNLKDGNKK